MSSAPSQSPSPADRDRRAGERRHRKILAHVRPRHRQRRPSPEALEPRTLLTALPAIQLDPDRPADPMGLDFSRDLSNSDGYESQPQVAVDPANPNHLATVWVEYNANFGAPTLYRARGAYSNDGGVTWNSFNAMPEGVRAVFPTSDPVAFAVVSDISVSFDRNGYLYMAQSQHSADLSNGVIVVASYDFKGNAPSLVDSKTLYTWNQSDQDYSNKSIRKPQLVVDNTLASYTDPATGQTRTNPGAGNVYLAWGTDVPPPQNPPNPWNRNTVELLTSVKAAGGGANPLNFGDPAVDGLTVGSGHVTLSHDAAPRVTVSQGNSGTGTAPGQVTVVFDDFGGGRTNSPPVDLIRVHRYAPQGDGTVAAIGGAQTVDFTGVLGAATSPYPLVTASNPRGIGPAPVIASDNTSGIASPNGGRLYIAYVDRYDSIRYGEPAVPNPADNTDIFLLYSDNGGVSWNQVSYTDSGLKRPVNDDDGFADGFSEGTSDPNQSPYYMTGRPQFQPDLAVDPVTGTVALSYLDARYDAARARTAVSVAVALPSGFGNDPEFSPSNFVNTPQHAFDIASRQDVVMGPIPDNPTASAYAGVADLGGVGDHQGLAILNGKLYQAWSSNVNAGDDDDNRDRRLDIRLAMADYAAGPRVIASTMGPVQSNTINGVTFNNRVTAQGVPVLDGFVVTFDRGVDPSSFTKDDVTVTYRGPSTSGSMPGTNVNVLSVTPLNAGAAGATRFLVRMADQSRTGTYSYTIGPDVRAALGGNRMDQDADGRLGEAGDDVYRAPTLGDKTTLPLMIGGPKVVRTFVLADDDHDPSTPAVPTTGADNLVTDQAISAVYVVFDRNMNPGSFDASDILGAVGPLAYRTDPKTGQPVLTTQLFGPFTISPAPKADPNNHDPDPNHPRTFKITFPAETLSGSYSFTIGPQVQSAGGDRLDTDQNAGLARLREEAASPEELVTRSYSQTTATTIGGGLAGATYTSTLHVPDGFLVKDVNLTLNIDYPRVADLSARLISPDGTISVPLFSNLKNTAPFANFTNTTLDDEATTPIQNAGPPFNGRFNPQQPLADLDDVQAAGDWTLEISVNADGTVGKILNWTLQLQQAQPTSGLGEPVADRAEVSFRIFTMDPETAQSSQTWTAVGPGGVDARVPGGNAEVAGRVNATALDPSDPSGNTAYIAGASGGIWKTTDFLTTDPAGPTYVPLTDNGPLAGMSINSIAVFGRNDDPDQSIIYAATGDAEALGDPNVRAGLTSRGLGILRSMDGGKTWELLDSTDNSKPFDQRDHYFASAPGQAGVSFYKVVVDPTPTPSGDVIVYAAVADIDGNGQATPSNAKGGFYRSLDSGLTWRRMRAGQATDIVLDPSSADTTTGNLRFLYAAFAGDGVYFSPNRGQNFDLMTGTTGNPLIQLADITSHPPIPVNPGDTPNGKPGRIVLAKPALTGDALKDGIYAGWLYAAVVGPNGDPTSGAQNLVGVYLTKDFGQNWTKLHLPAIFDTVHAPYLGLPSNDPTKPDIDPTGRATPGGTAWHLGNFDISLAVDPNDPDVIYLGATSQFHDTGLIRIDTTGVHDSKSFYLDNRDPDGGLRRMYVTADATTGSGVSVRQIDPPNYPGFDPVAEPYLNLIRDPNNPFVAGATIWVTNTAQFSNSGAQVRWTQFDRALKPDVYAQALGQFFNTPVDPWGRPARGVHQILTVRDPLTGANRLVFSTDQGVYTAVDKGDGTLIGSIGGQPTLDTDAGNVTVVQGSRNGNLQIAQMNSGAAQPSFLAAQLAALKGFLYGSAEDIGSPMSDPGILNPNSPGYGNLSWQGGFDANTVPDRNSSRGTVAVQQELQNVGGTPEGGTVYYWRPSEALVELLEPNQPADNQWPANDGRPSTDTFQVNGVARTFGLYQVANNGNVVDPQWPFRQGFNFTVNPLSGDQLLISSAAGRVFKTGDRGLVWAEVGNPGALDSTNAQALAYGAPDPNDATGGKVLDNFLYAGTAAGHIFVTFTGGGGNGNNWLPLSTGLDSSPVQAILPNPTRGTYEAYAVTQKGVYYNPNAKAGAAWQNITGNLFSIAHDSLDDGNGDDGSENLLLDLTTLQADWRYVIPDDFANPDGPTHPVLYAAGRGGVYRSIDKGKTWNRFPEVASTNLLDSPTPSGGLPNVRVTDLDLSLGNVDPTTGRPDTAGGANVLVASTFGRGQFAIRLAPIVLPNQAGQAPVLHLASDTESDTGLSQIDGITRNRTPFIVGYSEQTAFGNDVTVRLIDQTPESPTFGQVVGIGKTDEFGHLVTINADGSTHDGIRIQKVVDDVPVFDADGNPVPADLMKFDGKKVIGVQATNASGTKGNLAIVGDGTLTTIELDTTAPQAALLPDLQNGSDTGPSQADEITNPNHVAAPDTGALKFDTSFDANEVNTQVTLYRDNVAVGLPVLGTATAVVTDPGPISPDGTFAYKVRLTDQAGNVSPDSPVLNVRVDTKVPDKPLRPTLDHDHPVGGSDSGSPNDNITNVRQPFFVGNAEGNTLANPNDPGTIQRNIVTLLDQANNPVGSGFVSSSSRYSVQPSTPLGDGSYTFHVRVTDQAGNVSEDSDPITVTIKGATPSTPTLQMVLTDDSGVVGDNITNVKQPRFQGAGQPGLFVQIVDVNGRISGKAGSIIPFPAGAPPVIVANDGSFSFRFPFALPDSQGGRPYQIAARTIDIAGNFADSTPPLNFQILTKGPASGPIINLQAADDSGTKGDNVTSRRQIRIAGTGAEPHTTVVLFPNGATPDPSHELARATSDANGNFVLLPPSQLQNGSLVVVARQQDAAGNYGPVSRTRVNGQVVNGPLTVRLVTTSGDFDADGRADLAGFNRNSGLLSFGITGGGNLATSLGVAGPQTIPIQGDYDGDGKTDFGVVDYSTMTWTIARSQRGVLQRQFGWPGVDLPIQGDFDGDGVTDLANYRPLDSTFYVLLSSNGGALIQQFGQPNRDRPLVGDFDGDGKTDLMTYRPDTAEWIGRLSGGSVIRRQFGWPGVDVPVPADYDGDGKTDLANYRPLDSTFYVSLSSGGVLIQKLGNPGNGDIPTPQDFDGDGKADLAVFRPSSRQWLILQSSNHTPITRTLGQPGDIPLGAPLDPYRMPAGTSPVGLYSVNVPTVRTQAQTFAAIAPAVTTNNAPASTNTADRVNVALIPPTDPNPAPATTTPPSDDSTANPPTGGLGQGRASWRQERLLRLTALRQQRLASRLASVPTQALPSSRLALYLGRRSRG